MRAITVSTAFYGCESWTMTAETEQRIEAFEFRCLRRILRIPYTAHRTNVSVWTEITDEVGPQEHLLSTIKRRKMRWFDRSGQVDYAGFSGRKERKVKT